MQNDLHKETLAGRPMNLLSLYADSDASARAKWAANTIAKLAGPQWRVWSGMWRLDTITVSRPISNMVLNDAGDADVLIVAITSLEQQAHDLMFWVESLVRRKPAPSVPRLLIGLLGDDENRARELDWTIKQLMRCAQQTDRDFIWRWMEQSAMADPDWLTEHVEGLLARKRLWGESTILQEAPIGVVSFPR